MIVDVSKGQAVLEFYTEVPFCGTRTVQSTVWPVCGLFVAHCVLVSAEKGDWFCVCVCVCVGVSAVC